MNCLRLPFAWIVPVIALAFATSSFAADYKSFDEAYREGGKQLRDKKYAEAQFALEAALKLAQDDEDRLKAYEALVPAYRQLPEIDKMLEAQEFIIGRAEQRAKRSIAARDLASFLHQRGKADQGIERFEARLAKDARDMAALSVLAILYKNVRNDKDKAAELEARVVSQNLVLAQKLAEKHEAAAAAATKQQAWYWKEAALAWVEANDKVRALAAAKKSAAGSEDRTRLLAFYWREGLGQAFLGAGDSKAAIEQYEAAKAIAPSKLHQDNIDKKLAVAKGAKP
jgi:tetratricopeptide (TPR) repeat protein